MNRLSIAVTLLTAYCIACNNKPQQSQQQGDAKDTTEPVASVQIPSTVCYASQSGKDTVHLKLEKFPNVVTGNLSYKIFEKDASNGTIDGVLHGDTLIADYNFMSEGTTSTRHVAFLIHDTEALEGYGEMEEKDGKMVFKNTNAINFGSGIRLQKVPCNNEVAAAGGSELLFMYRWNLSEMKGKPVSFNDQKNIAHLLFTPGQVSTVAGSTGCNRLRGTFELSEMHNITFSPLITTKMACQGDNIEAGFLDAISKVKTWEANDKELVLKNGGTSLLKFKAETTAGN